MSDILVPNGDGTFTRYRDEHDGAFSRVVSTNGSIPRDKNLLLKTDGVPPASLGINGDYASDPVAEIMYGPKAGGVWPAGVSYANAPDKLIFKAHFNSVIYSPGMLGDAFVGRPRSVTASTTAIKADNNGLITYNSASAGTITITNDSLGGWSGNEFIAAYQAGAGGVSFVAGAGVTLRAPSGVAAAVQYGTIGVQRVGPNEWALV